MKRLMQKILVVSGVVLLSVTSVADVMELTWEEDQTAAVELAGETHIIIPAGKTVTCSGVISGEGKLVKKGDGLLILSAANGYTGGTQIDAGKLQADNAQSFGPVNASLPIQVNADLNSSEISATADNSIAVLINVATFSYPINCAAWTEHGARPKSNSGRGSDTLYNIAILSGGTLSGKITGGDVSIHNGKIDNWGKNSTAGEVLSIDAEIDVDGGSLAIASRGKAVSLKSKVRAGSIYLPTYKDWATEVKLYSEENAIGLIDCGLRLSAGVVTAVNANVMGDAVLVSTTLSFDDDMNKNTSENFSLGSNDQVIDRPRRYHDKALSAAFATQAHNITMNGGKTLTMKGSASDENDWLFVGAHNLVWDPTGDYTLLNVSRKHPVTGTITVNRGCFAMDENCTFSNVTALAVAGGAAISNRSEIVGSFRSVEAVSLGENAILYLATSPGIEAIPYELGEGAKIFLEEGVTLLAESLKYGSKYVKVGDYAKDKFVSGGGKITVLTNPGAVEETVVWQGGNGEAFSTAENWVGKTSTPDFEEGMTTLRFAKTGTVNFRAVVDVDANVKGLEFGDVATFEVAGDHQISLGEDGVKADDALLDDVSNTYEIAAPLTPICDQAWVFGSNVTFTLSGSLVADSQGVNPMVSVESKTFNALWFVGAGSADSSESSFAGTFRFKRVQLPTQDKCWTPQVFATGHEPFGSAATIVLEAAAQTVQSAGSQACLTLSNAVVSANIDNPYSSTDYRYGVGITSYAGTTNVVNGTVYNFRRYILAANSQLVFNGDVTIPDDFSTSSSLCAQFDLTDSSVLVFNGHLSFWGTDTYPGGVHLKQKGVCHFNASGMDIRYVGSGAKADWHFGADYAFDEGRTEVRFPTTFSEVDLHGHPQYIGSIVSTETQEAYRGRSVFRSSELNTTLKVNQTSDVEFYGYFDDSITNLTIGGTGVLSLKTQNAVRQDVILEGATLDLKAEMDMSEKAVIFAGGALSLATDMTVFKAYYVDNNGVTQPLPKGWFDSSDERIGRHLKGSGRLHVRKSDIPTGIVLIVR